jgi:hypothetical protein
MTVYFGNPGNFDVRAMLTFGVSAKEKEDAIGYFGTGFKYAVAIVLRLGGSIRVTSGTDTTIFTKSRQTIRGQDFDIVLANGKEAGFTTRLGINWLPWMAFRELWCNCKDEGGNASLEPLLNETVIAVDCKPIEDAFISKNEFLLVGEPRFSHSSCEIHDRPSHYLFYRGIAIKSTGDHAIYSYNVKSTMDLTEDRTARYDFQATHAIQRAIQSLDDAVMLRKILTAPQGTFEHGLGFDSDWTTSESFVEVARTLLKSGVGCNDSARRLISKLDDKAGNWPEVYLTKVQFTMLERARSFLKSIHVDVGDFELKVVSGLGEGVMGRALDGVIYLSEMPFHMGAKQVASTLLEEWVHNKHGVRDFDRAMQNWLFDKVVSLAEEMRGEPV